MARMLALCVLPRTDPGDRLQYIRRNGPYTLLVTATGGARLPYGILPRLLLTWVCTEAVRTQTREIALGDSLSSFMRDLNIYSSAGNARARLRDQMQRLFGCTVSLVYEDTSSTTTMTAPIARRTEFWNERPLDGPWDSLIELGEDFFNEVITCPVPVDRHILHAIKRSPLGLDLYFWLVYKTFNLKTPLRLTWPLLYRQFGADPTSTSATTQQAFRRDCLRELKKIKMAWSGLRYATPKGALLISPSRPRVAPLAAAPGQ